MRDNIEAECPEDYFRKSITVPFLYCTLNEIKVYRPTRQNRFWFHQLLLHRSVIIERDG